MKKKNIIILTIILLIVLIAGAYGTAMTVIKGKGYFIVAFVEIFIWEVLSFSPVLANPNLYIFSCLSVCCKDPVSFFHIIYFY